MRQPSRHGSITPSGRSILAYDIETIAPPMPDGSFPPWPTHQPVAIGFATAMCRDSNWAFDVEALVLGADTVEADMIIAADRRMAQAEIVTGYNSAQFHALVLRLAAQRCRIWSLDALADHAAAHRYGGNHADLEQFLCDVNRRGIPKRVEV